MKKSPPKVTALIQPWTASAEHPNVVGTRKFDAVDDFVAALGRALHTDIPIIEGSLRDAPEDGYVLLFEEPGLSATLGFGPRVVLINADRSSVRETIEFHQLACAVEKHRYFQWRSDRGNDDGKWIYGRKDVAQQMRATFVPGPPSTEHYGLIDSSEQTDLPSLLARYVLAYDALYGDAHDASGSPEGE